MALARGAPRLSPRLLQHALLIAVAYALLLTGFMGHLGVQVVDRALAEHVFTLSPNGSLFAREYAAAYGRPAPIVQARCQSAPYQPPLHAGPDQISAAGSLAGAAICVTWGDAPLASPVEWAEADTGVSPPPDHVPSLPLEPPR